MEREKKLVFNTAILSFGTLLPRLAIFVTLPILTGSLTKEEYGIYDLVTVLVVLYLPALTCQIQTAAFRFIIDARNNSKSVNTIISNIIFFTEIMSFLSVIVLYFIMFHYSRIDRFLICGYFLVDINSSTFSQISRGMAKNMDYSICSLLKSVSQIVLLVVLVLVLKMGLTGAIVSLLGASFFSGSYMFFRIKIYDMFHLELISFNEIKKCLKYSWPMVPNNMSMWVMKLSDRILVTFILGSEVNAVYAVANKIPTLLSQIQSTFTMAWQENASMFSKDEDVDKYYSSVYRIMFDFMSGTMSLLIGLTPILFAVLIRGDYDAAFQQIPILYLAVFFSCMASYLGGIYIAKMDTKSVGVTTFFSAVCNLIVNMCMIFWAGLYAASISTLVSYLLLFLFRLKDVKRHVKLKYDLKHTILVIIVLCVHLLLSSFRNIYCFLISGVFGLFVFLILNWVLLKKVTVVISKRICKTKKNRRM